MVSSGRGITLYEMIYDVSEQGNRKLYGRFLDGLEKVIGQNRSPILITDAEFRGPWFKLVLEKNWDFIARIRGTTFECCFVIFMFRAQVGCYPFAFTEKLNGIVC